MRWFSGFSRPTPCSVPTFWPFAFQSRPHRTHFRARVPRGWGHREEERQVAGHEHQRPSDGRTSGGHHSLECSHSVPGTAKPRQLIALCWLKPTTTGGEVCGVVAVDASSWSLASRQGDGGALSTLICRAFGSFTCTRSPVCIAVLHVLGPAEAVVSDVVRFLQPRIRRVPCVLSGRPAGMADLFSAE